MSMCKKQQMEIHAVSFTSNFLYLQVMNISGYSGKDRQEREGRESC